MNNQFNTLIILRTDNAKEFYSSCFSNFRSQHDIVHQSSCSFTPQQNSVAKRKNRHLIKVARTLLIHMLVPK